MNISDFNPALSTELSIFSSGFKCVVPTVMYDNLYFVSRSVAMIRLWANGINNALDSVLLAEDWRIISSVLPEHMWFFKIQCILRRLSAME